MPIDDTDNGEYSYMADLTDAKGIDLMYYNLRSCDPYINRFAQADSIVPPGVQGLDRYAYANNSPLVYTDSSGHSPQICTNSGWCWSFNDTGFSVALTTNVLDISANVYNAGGERIHSQFIDGRTELCGAVTVSAILRTQNPSYNGNQIISRLDNANIVTNGTSYEQVAAMAQYFGWQTMTTDANGCALALRGSVDERFATLKNFITQGWIPIVGMQTNGGYINGIGGTNHWVAVVGMSEIDGVKNVMVYNPVNDSVTEYSWEVFYEYLTIDWTTPDGAYTLDVNALVLVKPHRSPTTPRQPLGNQPIPY